MNSKTIALMYHDITEQSENKKLYDVCIRDFEAQMDFIYNCRRFRVVSLDALNNCPDDGKINIILTFDDGYSSWSERVLTILTGYGFPAYFFICTDFIKNKKIKESEICTLKENGMIIGAHGVSHNSFLELKSEEIYSELKESKNTLEKLLGSGINFFSVPRGMYPGGTLDLAKKAGYEKVFTSETGFLKPGKYSYPRFAVKRNTSLNEFKNLVFLRNIYEMILVQKTADLLKRILGFSAYNKLKGMFIKNLGE